MTDQSTDAAIDAALARHPAGRALRSGRIGFERIELTAADTLPVRDAEGQVVGTVTTPATYVLQCIAPRCGALLPIGSPLVRTHHEHHRQEAAARLHAQEVERRAGLALTIARDTLSWSHPDHGGSAPAYSVRNNLAVVRDVLAKGSIVPGSEPTPITTRKE